MVGSGCKNHPLPCASEAAARLPGVAACQWWILALPLLFLCQQCHPGALVPPRKRKPESKHAAANLPHVSTWSVEEVKGRRLGFQKDAKSAAEMREGLSPGRRNSGQDGKMESPDVDIAAMSKAQHRGRATQSALRVGRALEDEVILVTGALRGAGRNSISGSRARSAIGGAEAHHKQRTFRWAEQRAVLATAMERRLGLAVICLRNRE